MQPPLLDRAQGAAESEESHPLFYEADVVHLSKGRLFGLAFGLSSALFLPFWVVHFYIYGTTFNGNFVSNHYHYPSEEILDTTSGAVAWLVTFAIVVVIVGVSHRRSARAFFASIFILTLAAVSLKAWLGTSVVYRLISNSGMDLSINAEHALALAITAIIGGALAWLACRRRAYLERTLCEIIIRFGVPIGVVLALNVVTAAWQLGVPAALNYPLRGFQASAQGTSAQQARPRVIWFIFDGWDDRLSFERRDPTLDLPHTEALARSSFWARQAIAPHHGTLISLPSMLTGRQVEEDYVRLHDDMEIRFSGEQGHVRLSKQKNVFSDMADMGLNSVAMTHDLQGHPYCRLYHGLLADCWEAAPWGDGHVGLGQRWPGFFKTAADLVERYWLRDASRGLPGLGEKYEEFRAAVLSRVCDPKIDFLFVHWMLPHSPFFYDRASDSYTDGFWGPYATRYADNLKLTDKTLGMIVETLAACDSGRQTAYVVSADHGQTLPPNPIFLLRLPGEPNGRVVTQKLDLLNERALLAGIASGTLRTYDQAEAILQGTQTRAGLR
jgi:hypothetical protein